MNANRLQNQCEELEKEYQEKHHKVETWITSEGFVGWTVPVEKHHNGKILEKITSFNVYHDEFRFLNYMDTWNESLTHWYLYSEFNKTHLSLITYQHINEAGVNKAP